MSKALFFSKVRAIMGIGVLATGLAAGLAACNTGTIASAAQKPGAYELSNEASDLRFVTTKATNVAEVQQFKKLSGDIQANGTAHVTIDLASVETQIPLRNERIRELLFDVARFPSAQFSGTVDPAVTQKLAVGESADVDMAGKLVIRDQSQDVVAPLRVVKLSGDKLLVATRAPILVNAERFGLAPGIEKLREIMGLPNIVGTVPVNFTLVFKRSA